MLDVDGATREASRAAHQTIESERLLIMRDYAGALSAATRHLESPSPALFATRERALAVAVQAMHELGRGEEAFELVLSTVAGPGGRNNKADMQRYAQVANLDLLKLLFRLRKHLDGTPERAQTILAPYVAGLCRRSSDPYQRWKRQHSDEEVDTEIVELFLLDCVLALEVRASERQPRRVGTEGIRDAAACTALEPRPVPPPMLAPSLPRRSHDASTSRLPRRSLSRALRSRPRRSSPSPASCPRTQPPALGGRFSSASWVRRHLLQRMGRLQPRPSAQRPQHPTSRRP